MTRLRLTIPAVLAWAGLLGAMSSLGAGAFTASACGGGSGAAPAATAERANLDRPTVTGGAIRGAQAGGVRSFLGVPYAAPPVGSLRWRPPQPVEPWSGVRSCTKYGSSCPQKVGLMDTGLLGVGRTSEDCLYLNVWTPARTPRDRLPVMVWIHGGSFTSGSGSMGLYSGEELARAGRIVVVTINYRLGPFGFLAHPSLSAESPRHVSGNYGLLDQLAALRWVRRNIAAFGGDPRRVTAFGESAGAISILDLMASPLAKGLFQRAVVQSGILMEAGLGSQTGTTLASAERSGARSMRALGIDGGDARALKAMRALTPDQLLGAQPTPDFLAVGLGFKPVVDGYVLPASATEAFAAGTQQPVPLLIGSNADEGNTFVSQMGSPTPAQYRAYIRASFGAHAEEVLALYPAPTRAQVLPALSRLLTEMGFAATARFAAASMATARAGGKAYLYQFTRVPPALEATAGFPKGAFHGLEIPYVFGKAGDFGVTDTIDLSLSRQMMAMWTRFAAAGDPNELGDDRWPVYDRAHDRHLELGTRILVKADLYKEACDLADEIRLAE